MCAQLAVAGGRGTSLHPSHVLSMLHRAWGLHEGPLLPFDFRLSLSGSSVAAAGILAGSPGVTAVESRGHQGSEREPQTKTKS